MFIWLGALFVIAWGIGFVTLPHPGWFLYLPLLIGGAAMLYGVLRGRAAGA